MSVSGSVRRRQAGILLVGAIEPQAQPWLRAAGHATRAVRDAGAALAALDHESVDLVVADREPAGLDAQAVCGALREHPRFGEAWLLAIAPRRAADAVLRAGADDYVQRPFTRAELLARTNVGVRAARQRSDDSLLRALLVNVPARSTARPGTPGTSSSSSATRSSASRAIRPTTSSPARAGR